MTLKRSNIIHDTINRLSVQVSLTGLSFLVTDPDSTEVKFFAKKTFNSARTPEEVLLEIEEIMSIEDSLQYKFETVAVIYTNNIYAAIPTPLFDDSKASEYLKFNSKMLADDFIAYDAIESSDMTVVYVPYVNINNYFFERFGTFKYYHLASVFLKNVLTSEKHSTDTKMFVHIQKEQFDCVVTKNGNLQLCNSYLYRTPEDLVYYVLFCLEQLGLNPDSIPIVLSGEIEEDDPNFKILYTYIRHISFVETPELDTDDLEYTGTHKDYIITSVQ